MSEVRTSWHNNLKQSDENQTGSSIARKGDRNMWNLVWNVKSLASDNLATKQNKWKRNLERDICGMADENSFLLWLNVQRPGPCDFVRSDARGGDLSEESVFKYIVLTASDPPRRDQTEVAWLGPFTLLAQLVLYETMWCTTKENSPKSNRSSMAWPRLLAWLVPTK